MAKPPDLEALAKRYLDLWQEHLSGLAADPKLAEVMARTVELMNAGAAAVATMAAGQAAAFARDGKPPEDAAEGRGAGGAGPATAPPASRAADSLVAQLARRVAELEQRLARLEAGTQGKRRKARQRPRNRRS
jgi:hypothetical protein